MKDDSSFDLGLYWQVLRRRIWLLLIPVVLLTGILGLGSLLIPNIYRAIAGVVVRQEQDAAKGLAVESQLTEQLGGVIQELQQPMAEKEIFEGLKASAPRGLSLKEALADYSKHLQIRRREEGKDLIVDIIYEGTPEKYAVDVANAFVDEFQKRGTHLVANALAVSIEFVNDQLTTYRTRLAKLDEQERAVKARLQGELGDMSQQSALEGLDKSVATRLAEGDTNVQKLATDVRQAQAAADYYHGQLAGLPATLQVRSQDRGDQTEAQLERLVAEGQARLIAMQMRYKPEHPDIVTLKKQIEGFQDQLKSVRKQRGDERSDTPNPVYESLKRQAVMADAQLKAAQAELAAATQRNAKLRQVAGALPTFQDQLSHITEEKTALRTTYDALLQRKQALELNQSFEEGHNTGRFDIQRAGGVPLTPVRPNRVKYTLLGFLGGLFIGISFVLLAEYLDHSVRNTHDLRRYVDAPVLAVVPRAPQL